MGLVLGYDNLEEMRGKIALSSPSMLKGDFIDSYQLFRNGTK